MALDFVLLCSGFFSGVHPISLQLAVQLRTLRRSMFQDMLDTFLRLLVRTFTESHLQGPPAQPSIASMKKDSTTL